MEKTFWNNKKVAVTGSSGFLGEHFVKELEILGAKVNSLTREKTNLLNLEQTKDSLKNTEIVISCAALDGNAEFKKNHAVEILDHNMRIASNILSSAKENGIADVVLISSAEIYSSYAPSPIKEEDDYRLYGGHTSNGYILSKRFAEILADLYREELGIRVYLPRPSNIFGPGDHFGDQSTRVIPSFINKTINGLPIEIWGNGAQTRQFIYVRDVVQTVLRTVEKRVDGKMNVATNESISILDLAKKISAHLGLKSDVRLDETKSAGVKNRILDTSKMHQLIDFTPTDLETGLRETILWYKEKIKK